MAFSTVIQGFPALRIAVTTHVKLDPVSRVTGIPGWYWILEISCSDTTGVLYTEIVSSSLAKGIHLFHKRLSSDDR